VAEKAERPIIRRSKFTIWHGLAASLAFHSLLGLRFVLYALAEPPDEAPTLVIELQGAVADNQAEQKIQQETKGSTEKETTEPAKQAEAPPPEPAKDDSPPVEDKEATLPAPAPEPPKQTSKPPAEAKAGDAGANNIAGAEERQTAERIRTDRETEIEQLKEYVKLLSKRVQSHLVYPDEGRHAGLQGTTTVSFAILPSGQIRSETLKVVTSSGQPKLDASALKTIHASIPFDPAPREMTIVIAVEFGRKR
jgi:periplasmic protein TonB